MLPDHDTLLFTIWTGPGPDEHQIVAQSLATGERRPLVRGGDAARYLTTGYLVYARQDALLAVPWRASDSAIGGTAPIALLEHPKMMGEGDAHYAVSNEGTLVYVPGGAARYVKRLVWVDRAGHAEPVPLPERAYEDLAISPDGRQAAVALRDGTVGLWLYDFSRHTLTPFVTSGASSSQSPIWTPDGKRIVYRGTREGRRNLFWKAADGTGGEERLTTKNDVTHTPMAISSDGRWLIFREGGGPTKSDIWMMRLDGDRASTPQPFVNTPAEEGPGQLSPDGKWIAYVSDTSGLSEVFVQPFPGPGPRQQVSTGGGIDPLWSHDGHELFYRNGDTFLAVAIAGGPTFSPGAPHVLFEGRYPFSGTGVPSYGLSNDGRRFLLVQQVQPERPPNRIDVVLNWFTELKQFASTK